MSPSSSSPFKTNKNDDVACSSDAVSQSTCQFSIETLFFRFLCCNYNRLPFYSALLCQQPTKILPLNLTLPPNAIISQPILFAIAFHTLSLSLFLFRFLLFVPFINLFALFQTIELDSPLYDTEHEPLNFFLGELIFIGK